MPRKKKRSTTHRTSHGSSAKYIKTASIAPRVESDTISSSSSSEDFASQTHGRAITTSKKLHRNTSEYTKTEANVHHGPPHETREGRQRPVGLDPLSSKWTRNEARLETGGRLFKKKSKNENNMVDSVKTRPISYVAGGGSLHSGITVGRETPQL